MVNATRVLDSSVTDYAKRVVFRDFDVTHQLHTGDNALAVMLGRGHYSGSLTLIAQLDITYADGIRARIGTDGDWKSVPGPVTRDDFYYGESWDARKQIAGWDRAAFDDSAWTSVPVYSPVSQPTSLALNMSVTALHETACCGWSRTALVDGIDTSTDQSEGYHSAIASSLDSTKWVQVDLGRDQQMADITLFPARRTNDPAGEFPGVGFPVRYLVQPGRPDLRHLHDYRRPHRQRPGQPRHGPSSDQCVGHRPSRASEGKLGCSAAPRAARSALSSSAFTAAPRVDMGP
jgi:alpha-L-rhamnosidase